MGKASSLAQLLTCVLTSMNFSIRKNTISQKIPVDWRELAKADSVKIGNRFIEEDVEIVVNLDQTFVQFNPKAQYVIAPQGAQIIGRKIKMNEKAGFTVMVGVELNSSTMIDPFILF